MVQARVQEGMKVRSPSGAVMGKVVSCGHDSFRIEKGIVFRKDFTARYSDIDEVRENEVWLSVPRGALEEDKVGEGATEEFLVLPIDQGPSESLPEELTRSTRPRSDN